MITISTEEAAKILQNRISHSLQKLRLPKINNNILKVNENNNISLRHAILHYRNNKNQITITLGCVLNNVLQRNNSLTITGFLAFTEIAIRHPNIKEFVLLETTL